MLPKSELGCRATSPAATIGTSQSTTMPWSTRTPSVRSRPLPSSHSTLHTEPTASTTTDAGSSVPSSSRTALTRSPPRNDCTVRPRWKFTPCCSWRERRPRPSSAPSGRNIGCSSIATIWTSQPSPRAVAATSHPMKPAPMITAERPGAR